MRTVELASVFFTVAHLLASESHSDRPGVPNTKTAADSVVTFNEIMYHPAGDDPALEWIELYNQMSINMDLSNWRVEGGVEFAFPTNTVLAANRYLLIAADPARLRSATGFTNIVGPFTKTLANSGEQLRLRNNSGRLMDELEYSDEEPWPLGPDGFGASLAKRDRFFASSPAPNWRSSAEPGGTPGTDNFPPTQTAAESGLAINEVGAAGTSTFFVELANTGSSPLALSDFKIAFANREVIEAGTNVLQPGELFVLAEDRLPAPFGNNDPIVLLNADGAVLDAIKARNRGRARFKAGADNAWFYSSSETPGNANAITLHDEIVINEIMYHHRPVYRDGNIPFSENDEQWIELYNRSNRSVDLTGWRLRGEITFSFPFGTTLDPDSYLIIARNSEMLRARYPAISIIGDFSGRLSHRSGELILLDNYGNPADELTYFNDHPWPSMPNGGGSTLELKSPNTDNSVPEAWGASDESTRSRWRHYTFTAAAINPVYSPGIYSFHEFRMGLLNDGEALIDNVTVTENPATTSRQLIQNPGFEPGTEKWRLLGNHSHSFATADPDNPTNSVLRLVATGPTSYLDNRLETTLRYNGALNAVGAGRQYQISFDAKWLAGSPQLRMELYYNKVAATTILEMPNESGTPGRRNSLFEENTGPAFSSLRHSPVVPRATEEVSVSINAADHDGIAEVQLHYAVNGGAWRTNLMSLDADGVRYTATIPRQQNSAVIQFYVEATDKRGAISTYPGGGKSSRALIKVESPRSTNKQTVRTIMHGADSNRMHSAINMMSDDLLGCTIVHNEREVFYDAQIRLHGSMFSRSQPDLTGMTIKLPADHLFRGSRESIIVRRRGMIETVTKHMLNAVGGLPGNYDDVVYLISHRSDNIGNARLNLANYDDTYIDSQFEGNDDGTVFKLEGIREYLTTQNGQPEGLKLSQPIGWIQSFDITDLGDDPEQYRWGIMIQSARRRDDFSRIVALGKAFSLSGNALQTGAAETIDVDEWARLFALQSLLGIADVYGVENPHNFAMYVRPDDGKVIALQNDWEFAFQQSAGTSIYGSKNVYKILRLPGYRRLYQGHLLDMINGPVTSTYVNTWASHIGSVTGEGYTTLGSYIASRSAAVRRQLAAQIPFEITSHEGTNFTVGTPGVPLEGRGWIDVREIRQAGTTRPLAVTWLDDQRWLLDIPLSPGTNRIHLQAYDRRGNQVGEDEITVQSTASEFPQRDYLRITELMYHPSDPAVAEKALGFIDPEAFEYVELINQGSMPVSLQGVRFTAGISFDFSSVAVETLAPGQRVLIVADRAAFSARYGTNVLVAGEYAGSLSNSGEVLRLVDSHGGVIQEFAYSDTDGWPVWADGAGSSLEVLYPSESYSDPDNWKASKLGGTPGSSSDQPVILEVHADSGFLTLRFEAQAGQRYRIERTEALNLGAWAILRTLEPSPSNRLQEITDKADVESRFYRLVAE